MSTLTIQKIRLFLMIVNENRKFKKEFWKEFFFLREIAIDGIKRRLIVKRKRVALFLVLMLTSIALLAGCTPAEPAAEEPAMEPEVIIEEKIVEVPVNNTLVLSSRLWSVPTEQEFVINEILKPFEEEHGVKINFQVMDDTTMLQRAQVQQETDHVTTDVIIAYVANMPDWINNGYVTDMTSLIGTWDDRHFAKTFEANTNMNGMQYFIPVGADVYLTLANKKALPYLPEGADIDTLTWEQYADWAVNIAEGEGEGKVVVTGVPMKSFVYQFGATALSYGAGFPEINTPEAVEAWKILAKIGAADGYIPTVLNIDNCIDPMKREEAWLTVFHNARAGEVYSSNETKYVLAPAPAGPAGIGSIAGTSGFAIMKGAPNPELAETFLEYITRPDIQLKLSKGTGGFIPPVEEALEFLGNEPTDEVISKALLVLENGIVSGVPGGDFQDWGAVKQVFDNLFENMVLKGNVDQAMLDAASAEMDALRK
jgi:multiple sugar transport system substrate-binding protein